VTSTPTSTSDEYEYEYQYTQRLGRLIEGHVCTGSHWTLRNSTSIDAPSSFWPLRCAWGSACRAAKRICVTNSGVPSSSIPLNVAEASGKTSRAERAHHHAIARGSALQCAAILDVLALLGAASPEGVDRGKRLLERIVSMLTKMCR